MASERIQRSAGLDGFVISKFENVEVEIKDLIFGVLLAVCVVQDIVPYLDDVVVVIDVPINEGVHA